MIRYTHLRRAYLKRVDVLTFIVGFAVGAGILGLPVKFGSSGAGFFPSIVMLLLVMLFQIITAVYVVEAIDTYGPSEMPTLMSRALGRGAGAAVYFFIMMFLVGAMVAYIVFGGEAIHTLSRGVVPERVGMLIYWVVGIAFVFGGSRVIARAEEIMVALILLLLGINIVICLSTPYASVNNLLWGDWSKMLSVFGVVLFAFAIHSAIPTAYRSFGIDTWYHRLLAIGISLSGIIYISWSAAYMSMLTPTDYTRTFTGALTGKVYHGLSGLPAPIAVAELGKLRVAALLGYIFGFFTTMTSFIAAAHCLHQMNIDALRIRDKMKTRLLLMIAATLVLILALSNIGSFISWINFAGSVGAAAFTGIIPSLVAIKLRIRKPNQFTPLLPGGVAVATMSLVFYITGLIWYLYNILL